MDVKTLNIAQLFEGWKQYSVPLFQRPYTWTKKDWQVLYDDILAQYDGEESAAHFLGAIVTIVDPQSKSTITRHLVIDGQQRISTLSVLLCALRDNLPDSAVAAKRRVESYLLNDGQEGADTVKLVPTDLDNITYQSLATSPIQAKSLRDSSSSGLIGAYTFFSRLLKRKGVDGEVVDCVRLLEVIERRFVVVRIDLDDSDNPYVIFESLNAKGQPLDQVDLVRNHVFMMLRGDRQNQREVLQGSWQPMEQMLDSDFSEYIRHSLMKSGRVVNKREIYSHFKQHTAGSSPSEVAALLDKLHARAPLYRSLIDPEENRGCLPNSVLPALARLAEINFRTPFPLLLRLADAFLERRISDVQLARAAAAIESLVVRRTFCKVLTNPLNVMFTKFCSEFPSERCDDWLVERMAAMSGGSRWPDDREFHEGWRNFDIFKSNRKMATLILQRLETEGLGGSASAVEDSEIHLVMPEELGVYWKSVLPPDDVARAPRFVGTVGNLTLLDPEIAEDDNSQRQVDVLHVRSRFRLNSYFSAFADRERSWTVREILQRSSALFEVARKLWFHPGTSEGHL